MAAANHADWTRTIEQMHRDNRRWRGEHARWQEEIRHWQQEANRLTAVLFRLERAIPEYGDTLKDHAFEILQHDLGLRHHERKLAAVLRHKAGNPVSREILQDEHREQANLHRDVRRQHQEMRRLHQEAIDEIRRLTRLADEIAQQIPDSPD